MMITALVSIQSVCVGISAYLVFKSNQKTTKVKKMKTDKGFKYYKAGGF